METVLFILCQGFKLGQPPRTVCLFYTLISLCTCSFFWKGSIFLLGRREVRDPKKVPWALYPALLLPVSDRIHKADCVLSLNHFVL